MVEIIDSHTHIGEFENLKFTCETLLSGMRTFGVSKGIVSTITGNEFNYSFNLIKTDKKQIEINDEMLHEIKKYKGKLKALFWIRPFSETADYKLERYLTKNKYWYLGLKVHPRCANLRFSVENYKSYLELCEKLRIPFCVHTEKDGYSDIEFVHQVASQYTTIDFIAVHMELGSSHEKAIQYISECPNLYGDTTIVDLGDVMKALDICGSKKILFGSDAPAFGKDSYKTYYSFEESLSKRFNVFDINNLFSNNANRIFKNLQVDFHEQ